MNRSISIFKDPALLNRRRMLQGAPALFAVPGLFAERLRLTPSQTEGASIRISFRWTATTI